MEPLRRKERLVGFGAAGLSALLTGAYAIHPWAHKPAVAHGTQAAKAAASALSAAYSPTNALVVGIATTLLLLWATLTGKRLFLGVVALFTGSFNPWGAIPQLAGAPFLILAAWQLVRWSRLAGLRVEARRRIAEQEEKAKGTHGASTPREGGRRSRRGSAPLTPGRPVASKRYTPPKR